MFCAWVSAVRTEIVSRVAICLLLRPSEISSAISSSRAVSTESGFDDTAAEGLGSPRE